MRWSSLAVALLVGCGTTPADGGDRNSEASTGGTGDDATGTTVEAGTTIAGEDGASTAVADGDETTGSVPTGGSSATTDDAGTDGGTGGAFVHDYGTELSRDGRLALYSNLPPTVDACLRLPAEAVRCEDADEDTLVDAWEDAVLERLRPLRRLDEAESAVDDEQATFADVGRVAPRGDGWLVLVMLGYSRDYGSCGGFTSHPGDSERVAFTLDAYPEGGAGGVVFTAAYTAAHEGTINDHGQIYPTAMLDALVFDVDVTTLEPRWVVFPSADKHATYANIATCEGISVLPCVDEDCAPDGVDDPSAFDLLPPFANAGEANAPRVTDLGPLGFPGDDAWAEQDFCGGVAEPGCSASVRSKLIDDPFP